jgi:putative ABC transport system ATP-binding protein
MPPPEADVPPPTQDIAASGHDAVRIRGLSRHRAKGGNEFELSVPSFSVRPGEFVAIVGESGCGKSTLLDMLGLVLGATRADAFQLRDATGRAFDVTSLDEPGRAALRRSLLGYVLQTGGLLPFLSVEENILLPCRINGQSGRRQDVLELAHRLGIGGQLRKKPQFLSGGQRQRAAIARALAHRPDIVLADEPTAAVDGVTAREIRSTFRQLTRQMQVALLMVTHDTALVEGVADRVYTFDVSKESEHRTRSVCREARP